MVTAHGQTPSSPLTYSLCCVFSLVISTPIGGMIGLYTLSSRWGFHIGYCIAKGVSERCIMRLLLTFPEHIEQKILLLEHVNYFTTMQIKIKIMSVI